MNPDSPGRLGRRLIAGAAVGLVAAAAFAAPVAAQETAYEPFLHGDVKIAEAAPGATANVTPVFLHQQDLTTSTVVVHFDDATATRGTTLIAEATEEYDNCGDAADGGIDCVFTDFTGELGSAFTLSGPIGYAVAADAPGPIEVCGCSYSVTPVELSTVEEDYGDLVPVPDSPNPLAIVPAETPWDGTGATADAGDVSLTTTENQLDLYVGSSVEELTGGIGSTPDLRLWLGNDSTTAAGYDLAGDEPGSYVLRGQMPDGIDLTALNADGNAAWTCLDESELAAEYERTESTQLERFDFVCYVQAIAANTETGILLETWITEGQGNAGRFEVAAAYDGAEALESDAGDEFLFVLNGLPFVPLARNDFNNDGLDDFVAVRESDGALRFYPGKGNGSFGAATTMATGFGGFDVVMAGELNSDGYADLLVRDNKTGTLYTYPGNGNGGLKERIRSGTGWNVMSVFTTLDFDGDGMMDILAARESTGVLSYYSGKGNGTFGNGVQWTTGYNNVDALISTGDIDHDGGEDFMIRTAWDQEYMVFTTSGEEAVILDPYLSGPTTTQFRQVVGAGDLDRDGLLDLLSVGTRSSGLYRQEFNLGGSIAEYQTVSASGWLGMSLPMATLDRSRDLDMDGATDVLARRSSNKVTSIYFGNGTGGWGPNYEWDSNFSGMNLIETSGDFTGDNLPDVLTRTTGGVLYVYPGDGFGYYDNDGRIRIGGGWNAMSAIVSGSDYNGDNKNDIIARESATGNLWLYPGNNAGSHGARVLIGTGWNGMSLITAVGDLDHDGAADVIARKNSDNCMYFYAGKPAGGVKNGVKIGCGWNVMNTVAAVGDFNGDGHFDWVARHTNGSLYLYKGNGAGTYSGSVVIGSGWGGMDIIA
jgi:hypothetical protein